MKTIGKFFDGLDRFGGVIQAIGILIIGVKFVFENLKRINLICIIVIAIALILVAIALLRKVASSLKEYEIRKLEKNIAEVSSLSIQKHDFSINDILTSKQITDWLKTTDYHATKWSEDAKRKESPRTYYLTFSDGRVNHHLNAEYYSDIKRESLSLSYGGFPGPSLSEIEPSTPYSSDFTPFYINQPLWRKALMKVIKTFEDKWDGRFSVFIYNAGDDRVQFDYNYTRGSNKVNVRGKFVFDGNYLINEKANIKV